MAAGLAAGAIALIPEPAPTDGATASRGTTAAQSPSGMPPGRLAGLRVIAGFDGTAPPRALRRMIRAGRIGGVILFSRNVRGRGQVARLTRRLQAIPRPPGLRKPLLVMADQEGGLVRRLPGPPKPSAAEVGRRGARYARGLGAAAGKSMRAMGVNVNLAPVADVRRRGGFIAAQRRSYAGKTARAGRIAAAFARGLEAKHVAATAKHFPGLGMAVGNTDERKVKIRTPLGTLRRVDEKAYRPFLRGGGEMVMLSMARYTALGGGPAAASRRIATRELRGRLGFRGVSIADALLTPSAASIGNTAEVARRVARAGTDLLLYSDLGAAARAHRSLKRGLLRGALARAGFERTAERVLDLRRRIGRRAL